MVFLSLNKSSFNYDPFDKCMASWLLLTFKVDGFLSKLLPEQGCQTSRLQAGCVLHWPCPYPAWRRVRGVAVCHVTMPWWLEVDTPVLEFLFLCNKHYFEFMVSVSVLSIIGNSTVWVGCTRDTHVNHWNTGPSWQYCNQGIQQSNDVITSIVTCVS